MTFLRYLLSAAVAAAVSLGAASGPDPTGAPSGPSGPPAFPGGVVRGDEALLFSIGPADSSVSPYLRVALRIAALRRATAEERGSERTRNIREDRIALLEAALRRRMEFLEQALCRP